LLVSSENQHIKIEEIAEMVGYNSKSAFNTAFKKIVGQTPSQYRKEEK
jgi:AraC-like DNA-binding protein